MAETLVENQICKACGAGVRQNAIFCYNCGKSVVPEIVVRESGEKDKINNVWLREKSAENGNREKLEEKAESLTVEQIAPISKSDNSEQTKLESAAAMRRKSATFQKKTVEVVWEEHENAPNALFIVVAIIITLFAAGILYLAIYLQ